MPEDLRRLAIIAFDAMDAELVRRWSAAGFLPAFRGLLEGAAFTAYDDPPNYWSGPLWPSIHRSWRPIRHGCYCPLTIVPGSYRLRWGELDDAKGDPVWRWFAEAGRRVVFADVPFLKVDPACGRKQFWGWNVHDWIAKRASVPGGLLADLTARFGAHPVPDCFDVSCDASSLARFRSGLVEGAERRTAIFRSLVAADDWDLFFGAYSEAHCGGHWLWHVDDASHPRHRPEEAAVVGPHALRDVYAALDRGLGELLAAVPSEVPCAVFLSHGMGPNYSGHHLLPEILSRFNERWEGKRSGTGAGADTARTESGTGTGAGGGWVNSLWTAGPARLPLAWRLRLKSRIPKRLRQWLALRRMAKPKMWSSAPAFVIPEDHFASVRVNLEDREPNGRIRPGAEYRRYLDDLAAELAALRNAETGGPVLEMFHRGDAEADPLALGQQMDLMAWWCKAAPIRAIRSPTLGMIAGDEDIDLRPRSGNHIMRGMLILRAPRAKPGRREIPGMNVLDVAPTLCDLAAVRPGAPIEGVSRARELLGLAP